MRFSLPPQVLPGRKQPSPFVALPAAARTTAYGRAGTRLFADDSPEVPLISGKICYKTLFTDRFPARKFNLRFIVSYKNSRNKEYNTRRPKP